MCGQNKEIMKISTWFVILVSDGLWLRCLVR